MGVDWEEVINITNKDTSLAFVMIALGWGLCRQLFVYSYRKPTVTCMLWRAAIRWYYVVL